MVSGHQLSFSISRRHCRRLFGSLFPLLLCSLFGSVVSLAKSNDNMVMKTFTSPLLDQHTTKTALIILNTPIQRPPSKWFEKLWELSSERICADGGANRLYEATQEPSSLDNSNNKMKYIPNRIRGDLDSLDPKVKEYYEKHKCSIERDPCQDTNDLDKALQVCVNDDDDGNDKKKKKLERVIVYGAFGGRFDQEMASLHALYKWGPKFDYQLFLYNDETCAFLIPPNTLCEIRLPFYDTHCSDCCDGTIGEGPTCGLIPLGSPCDSITTTGLKWNLDGSLPLGFGDFISTSNRVMEPVVTIQSSHPIVFTAELRQETTATYDNSGA